MANTQAPFGFRPVRNLLSSAPTYQLTQYPMAYNNSNKIARGDPVLLNSSGLIDILTPGTTAIFGIFWGVSYFTPGAVVTNWWPSWNAPTNLLSSQVPQALIIDDPRVVFEVQAGQSSSVPIDQTAVGNNGQFAGQGTPNSAGISTAYISSVASTNTFPFRIVGLSKKIGNDNTAPYNTVEVVMNFAQLNVTTGV